MKEKETVCNILSVYLLAEVPAPSVRNSTKFKIGAKKILILVYLYRDVPAGEGGTGYHESGIMPAAWALLGKFYDNFMAFILDPMQDLHAVS